MSELRSTATCLIKLNVLPSVGPQNDILILRSQTETEIFNPQYFIYQ